MRKVIAAFNTTIDGNCDHTAGIADEELDQHYADLLHNAGVSTCKFKDVTKIYLSHYNSKQYDKISY